MAKYSKEPTMGSSKRLFISVVDSAILVVLSFLLMLLINSLILPSISGFAASLKTLDDERLSCLKMSEEAGLNEFSEEGGEKIYDTNHTRNTEYLFKKYIRSHILLAYEKDVDAFEGVDMTPLNAYKIEKASFENDIFAKFYVSYCEQYNTYKGKEYDLIDLEIPGKVEKATYKEYFAYILRNKTKHDPSDQFSNIWVDSSVVGEEDFTYMNGEFAKNLYVGIEFDKNNTTLMKYYNVIRIGFENLYNAATDSLFNSSRYREHFNVYSSTYSFCAIMYDLGSLVSYIISFFLTFLLPGSLIFKKGTTFSMYLFKGRVIANNEEEVDYKKLIVRYIVMFFTYFGTLVISTYFSGGLITAAMYPLFTIGDVGISFFHITILFLFVGLVNALIMAFTYSHHSVTEMISGTEIVDIKDYNPNAVVKDDSNIVSETAKQTTGDSGDYFDSSCFDNIERRKK